MRIILITQDEPFYLAKNIDYLLNILPKEHQVVGAVIANPSPFGKKESFIKKAKKTLSIFGIKFFIFYSIKYIIHFFDTKKNVQSILLLYCFFLVLWNLVLFLRILRLPACWFCTLSCSVSLFQGIY